MDKIENKNILIATPAYNDQVYTGYTNSLIKTCLMLNNMNIKFDIKFIGNQIVTRARNMLASLFMENELFTHMIFIDSDITWKPEDIIKLLDHDLECVIGVYPNKQYYLDDNGKPMLFPSSVFEQGNIKIKNKNENLIKIKYAATGFMCLKKSALIKIQKDVNKFKLPGLKNEIITLYNYFDCNVVDEDYLTEDYYFSYLFNKNGGEIYSDKTIKLLHTGTHTYGNIIDTK